MGSLDDPKVCAVLDGLHRSARREQGVIRALNSVPVTARFMLESLAWFGKQGSGRPFSKNQALPNLVSILVRGLQR
jgi:hypothetical protein